MGFWGAAGRLAGLRASEATVGGGAPGAAGYLNNQTRQGLVIAAISGGLFWLVWIYGNGLRDPNYLNGWLLASGMSLQVYFHIALKTGSLPPKSATRWRKIHIFLGYLLVAAFLSHTDFSMPDSGFEWALWLGFVLVTLSGILGTYLSWALKAKRLVDERLALDRIPSRYVELQRDVHATVARPDPAAAAIALPAVPHDAWIRDLYANQLKDFFKGPRNFAAHFVGSQRPLKRLTDEIDGLSLYVDQQGQEKLAIVKDLVIEKDRLDFARVYLGLTKAWLFVHVPVTYALVVLVVLHVVVAYSFSAGSW
jgi:hypothetical protein